MNVIIQSVSGRFVRAALAALAMAALALVAQYAAAAENLEYPFRESPTKVLSVLSGLPETAALEHFFTPAELALLHDAGDGPLHSMSLAEAALLACGVRDDAQRRSYLARLDAIEADARRAVAGARSAAEAGRRLLAFLHRGPMAGGYVSGQADLSVLLDTGRFNCVSSCVLYNILAERIGLRVAAIEVPEHVFSVVYDGRKWVDVETTNPKGFDRPLDRPSLEAKRKKFVNSPKTRTPFRYGVDDMRLIAIAYFCHGTRLGKEEHYDEAISAKLFALALDPANAHTADSATYEIGRCCRALIKVGNRHDAFSLAQNYEQVLKNPARAKKLERQATQGSRAK